MVAVKTSRPGSGLTLANAISAKNTTLCCQTRFRQRFYTWTFTFHHIHERFSSRNIRYTLYMYADDSTLYTTDKRVADINRSLTTNSKLLTYIYLGSS